MNIGVGVGGGGARFRILGGGRGGQGGPTFRWLQTDQSPLLPAPAPNQCQIITVLTLETDDIAKLRIELKSILSEIPSNKIKGT